MFGRACASCWLEEEGKSATAFFSLCGADDVIFVIFLRGSKAAGSGAFTKASSSLKPKKKEIDFLIYDLLSIGILGARIATLRAQ
jgi:hypothetical protein